MGSAVSNVAIPPPVIQTRAARVHTKPQIRSNATAQLSPATIERFANALQGDIKSSLASVLLSKTDFVSALNDPKATIEDVGIYNVKLSTEVSL